MANHASMVESVANGLRHSPLLRLCALGLLMLFLMIPIEWISDLIGERMVRRGEAVAEVSAKWGGAQRFVGPALVVPYEHRWSEPDAKGKPVQKREMRQLTILPSDLRMRARVEGEERYRGIFAVPVYRVGVEVDGEFAAPDLAELRIDPTLVDWPRAQLALGVRDARAIQNRASVTWNDVPHDFLPGPGAFPVESGIHAPLAQPFAVPRPHFHFRLDAHGSGGLSFTPAGQQTTVSAESNWLSPSFQGSWLPVERHADAQGFRSTWTIPYLGRNQAPAWTSESSGMIDQLEKLAFGVDLVTPVDAHRTSERSVKYARLFVLMTFGIVWLIEVLTGVRVHPIQYLLIGCALCTFYLLELSLAEQIGFASAYAIAATAVVGLIAGYAVVVLRGWRRGAAVAGTIAAVYGYLYVLLTNEDYALLLGSLGVFAALAATMALTRHVDWYAQTTRTTHTVAPTLAPPEAL
ncbi:MAG: cell envelope integrity protein CreD [Deltaproteobacteria bacterium]|nr:cell envelope integrity protein CreD [Deltaproteobacteria bacterium]